MFGGPDGSNGTVASSAIARFRIRWASSALALAPPLACQRHIVLLRVRGGAH